MWHSRQKGTKDRSWNVGYGRIVFFALHILHRLVHWVMRENVCIVQDPQDMHLRMSSSVVVVFCDHGMRKKGMGGIFCIIIIFWERFGRFSNIYLFNSEFTNLPQIGYIPARYATASEGCGFFCSSAAAGLCRWHTMQEMLLGKGEKMASECTLTACLQKQNSLRRNRNIIGGLTLPLARVA